MSRAGLLACAALALCSAGTVAALADGLDPSEALRYDQRYLCNGERLVVSHCGGETDSASCQVVYLDRPAGPTRDRIETRGDILRRLRACAGPPPPAAKAPAPQAQAVQPAAKTPARKYSATLPPLGPELCPTIGRLIALTHEDFRSIDGGPDRTAKDPNYSHLSSLKLPGADCYITHETGEPPRYVCLWPQSNDTDDRFFDIVDTLAKCTRAKPDISMLEEADIPDITVTSQGVAFNAAVMNDFLSFDAVRAKPSGPAPGRGRGPAPAKP